MKPIRSRLFALTLGLSVPFALQPQVLALPAVADLDEDGLGNDVDPDIDNDGLPNGLDRNVDGG